MHDACIDCNRIQEFVAAFFLQDIFYGLKLFLAHFFAHWPQNANWLMLFEPNSIM